MLDFKKLESGDVVKLAPYFREQKTHISDYSLGFEFMWGKSLSLDWCIAKNCLILHEFYAGSSYFYYPLSLSGDLREEEAALDEIEKHCREKDARLHFTNIPEERVMLLLKRYGRDCTVNNRRRWRDYLYRAKDFIEFAGGKFSGQRNHINKFKKLYTGWKFQEYRPEMYDDLKKFLGEVAKIQTSKDDYLAREEMEETLKIIPVMKDLGIFAGVLTVDGKIVGFSAGERCGDMIIVHIEKALRSFEGAYPMLAQQFARAFCGDGVEYLNRMDDAGDMGLRKSKLQYLPCEIVGKYNILPRRAIDEISHLPEIETERLTIAPVEDKDVAKYATLARDVERNKYWGYDWRKDYYFEKPDDMPPDDYFLYVAREDFKHKDEMSLGVFLEGELIGEVVLHRFGYHAEVELGVRLLKEAEGRGYAREAMRALAEYAFLKLNMEVCEAKCFKENERSNKMLRAAGFRPCGEDETFYYFSMTPSD